MDNMVSEKTRRDPLQQIGLLFYFWSHIFYTKFSKKATVVEELRMEKGNFIYA